MEKQRARLEKTHDEAARWLARIDRGLRPEEGPQLRAWLQDSVNRNVIVESARLSASPEVAGLLSELCPDNPELLKPVRHGRSYIKASIAAVVAMSIVVIFLFALAGTMPWLYFGQDRVRAPEHISTTYTTAVGEKREVKLPDSSTVTLNTRSRITVTYSQATRDVNLEYGEASFNVVLNPARPFNVRAGKRAFQSLGTRFIVRIHTPDNVELTVTEGEVKVVYAPPRWPETPEKRRENLTFGEQTLGALETALVEPGYQSVRTLVKGEAEARAAWQRGMIVFDRTPLAEALAEVDRYTNIEFVVADDRLRGIPVAGDFRTGDVDGLLAALRKNFSIDSRRDAQGRIVLTPLNAL